MEWVVPTHKNNHERSQATNVTIRVVPREFYALVPRFWDGGFLLSKKQPVC